MIGEAPYRFLPPGIAIGTFLGALAYAGAGGNLNLAQSCYVRDKGYGMGKYADKITSIITAKTERNNSPSRVPRSLPRKTICGSVHGGKRSNLEHALIFLGTRPLHHAHALALASITTFGQGSAEGINFVVAEAAAIGGRTFPLLGALFLLITGIMLATTAAHGARFHEQNHHREHSAPRRRHAAERSKKRTTQCSGCKILFGIAVFSLGFDQPLSLVVLGAIINAFSMFVYCGIILVLNNRLLAKPLRPSAWRNMILAGTFLFFGYFCAETLLTKLG